MKVKVYYIPKKNPNTNSMFNPNNECGMHYNLRGNITSAMFVEETLPVVLHTSFLYLLRIVSIWEKQRQYWPLSLTLWDGMAMCWRTYLISLGAVHTWWSSVTAKPSECLVWALSLQQHCQHHLHVGRIRPLPLLYTLQLLISLVRGQRWITRLDGRSSIVWDTRYSKYCFCSKLQVWLRVWIQRICVSPEKLLSSQQYYVNNRIHRAKAQHAVQSVSVNKSTPTQEVVCV